MKRLELQCVDPLVSVAFEYQPTPIIITSVTDTIVVANRASRTLFQTDQVLIGSNVRALPILWRDGTEEAFHELWLQGADCNHLNLDKHEDERASNVLKLQVDICDGSIAPTFSACMLVTDLTSLGENLRMLSFENVEEHHIVHAKFLGLDRSRKVCVTVDERDAIVDGCSSDTRCSSSSQAHLDAKLAKFYDAIYFGNCQRVGFILSADETFCLPKYMPSRSVVPVEITDVAQFFKSWDVWNSDFTQQISFKEYPSIWLNTHRVNFEKRRYGLREADKNYVFEASGDPLYDHETNEYIGGVVWLKNLGDYETVVANDLVKPLADFQTICDRLPHLLWTVNSEGEADYFSQSWYDFTGRSEEQSLGLAFQAAVESDDMQKIWAAFAVASETKTECSVEARYQRHDGKYIWMSVRAKPVFDASGKLLKWYGTSTDIHSLVTERIEAERQKSQMRQMLSLADVGLFEVDSTWRLSVVSGRMLWLDKQQGPQLLTNLDQLSDDGIRGFQERLQDVMAARQESVVFEEKIGARWYKFRLAGDTDGHGGASVRRQVLGCSVDITEQRERTALESENARLTNEALLETEKNRLKTAFLAHMSHEIRTPIAGIVGTAEMLADSNVNNEQQEGINDIKVLANSLLTIVNDILDFSKIEAGKLRFEKTSFDIYNLVLQVKKVFGHMIRDKPLVITCLHNPSAQLDMIGDPGRVKQILMNLVSNAAKFTPEGSIDLSVTIGGPHIWIRVEDTGIGIDDETMSTLFRPFVQGDASTARRHGGTGLGLSISRNLAEMMGGSLTLRSVPSKGTIATLVLPKDADSSGLHLVDVALEVQKNILRDLPATGNPHGKTPKSDHMVLIVEDNAINQKVALNMVRKLGYCTQAVWNGQEALEFIEKERTPSLILMDCQMPILDGYDTTHELRTDTRYEQAKAVPIIALTASAIQGDQEKCYAAGMDDYLSKPISKNLLQKMLDKWLAEPRTCSS